MKDQFSLIIAAVALGFVAIRLYQKYVKKNDQGSRDNSRNIPGSMPRTDKNDDYEPYSKR